MTKPERLVLKHATGWFAAGWEFGDAMMLLSDAGFKLFAWICLNADRHSGRIRLPVDEIARHLRREPGWVEAGWRELERSGLCRQVGDGWTEVSDRFWPYEKQARAGAGGYVEQVRRLLCAPACVRCRFTAADEKLARELERRGVTVAQIERAILLGCSRKYASMLANPAAWTPIASLSYFTALIDEVCRTGTPESYWAYVARTAAEMERLWSSKAREVREQGGTPKP